MQSRIFSSCARVATLRAFKSSSRSIATGAFPSLKIYADKVEANGQFAETQAQFLNVDMKLVNELDHFMESEKIGIVAHFYMDAEIQGLLSKLKSKHIAIADSLVMGQKACNMVKDGCKNIICMGVDFMSENCRAQLDADGFNSIPVYRTNTRPIGCTLAEAAENQGYLAYLKQAEHKKALHMIYINTSLQVKALSESIVPTITCTSGNVVQLLMQSITQVPDLQIFYGPDSYMGNNLKTILHDYQDLSKEQLLAINPKLTRDILEKAEKNFHSYTQGYCAVHHIFGQNVANIIKNNYSDAYLTSHLEVPTEMFKLTLDYKNQYNRGCVGSTADILKYIKQLITTEKKENLDIILGTEAGMVCSIISTVQKMIQESHGTIATKSVNIIFPVGNDAIVQTNDKNTPIIPGARAEGCSIHGGCATCPFMKMNSADNLRNVMEMIQNHSSSLEQYKPKVYNNKVNGTRVQDLGTIPIQRMRDYQKTKSLPDSLVNAITKH
ncbi:hypothetical protein WA158_000083 [Blastocystis sp. Blastoise]